MKMLGKKCHSWLISALSAFCAAGGFPLLALAQEAGKDEKSAGPTLWAIPYILVVLAIGLGIMVLCSPVRRDDKRRED